MAGIFEIVGYDFKGERLCPPCTKQAVTLTETGVGGLYDGWADATGEMDTEEFLQGIAEAFNVNRMIEDRFSAAEFPKVVFRGHVGFETVCDCCGDPL